MLKKEGKMEKLDKEEIMKELSKKIAEGWAYHDYTMLDSTTLLKETISDPIERVKKSYGAPLSPELRKEFEPIMGFKMSDVKIHTDKTSQNVAKNLNAEAFTYGKDIYFAQDKYNPETTSGKALIGHELTHIAQQKGKVGELAMKGFSPTQNLEKQAENMEKYLTEVFARSKSPEPLVKIDDIEIKSQDKEQEKDIRFLRIKTMIESLIEPYIYKELSNNPELAQYLMTHNVAIDNIEGMSDLNLDSDVQIGELIQKIASIVKNVLKEKSLKFSKSLIFFGESIHYKKRKHSNYSKFEVNQQGYLRKFWVHDGRLFMRTRVNDIILPNVSINLEKVNNLSMARKKLISIERGLIKSGVRAKKANSYEKVLLSTLKSLNLVICVGREINEYREQKALKELERIKQILQCSGVDLSNIDFSKRGKSRKYSLSLSKLRGWNWLGLGSLLGGGIAFILNEDYNRITRKYYTTPREEFEEKWNFFTTLVSIWLTNLASKLAAGVKIPTAAKITRKSLTRQIREVFKSDDIFYLINENRKIIGAIKYKDVPLGSFMWEYPYPIHGIKGEIFADIMHVPGGALFELMKFVK